MGASITVNVAEFIEVLNCNIDSKIQNEEMNLLAPTFVAFELKRLLENILG